MKIAETERKVNDEVMKASNANNEFEITLDGYTRKVENLEIQVNNLTSEKRNLTRRLEDATEQIQDLRKQLNDELEKHIDLTS